MRRVKVRTAIVAAAVVLSGLSAPQAFAETFKFTSSPLTNLNPAGATINGGFTAFPAGKGLYIQQCVEPVAGARPTICSDAVEVWVSDVSQGATKSTGGIVVKPLAQISGRGGSADCTKVTCGLFFRVDRFGPNDLSEDKFMPISFAPGVAGPVLPTDVLTVTADGAPLTKNVPSNLIYRKGVAITVSAQSGLTPEVSSATPDCSYANGVITALKGSGLCALSVKTAGNASFAATSANYPFYVGLGEQSIPQIAANVKKGKTLTLPTESSFGEKITFTTASKNCSIKGNKVKGLKKGNCVVVARAAGKADFWKPLVRNFTIKVS
jgi:hypothetical protein